MDSEGGGRVSKDPGYQDGIGYQIDLVCLPVLVVVTAQCQCQHPHPGLLFTAFEQTFPTPVLWVATGHNLVCWIAWWSDLQDTEGMGLKEQPNAAG